MTVKGLRPVPIHIRRAIARLVQLHYETHPKRIAATVGLSPAYCTRLWRHMDQEEWPHVIAALQMFVDMKRAKETYAEHEIAPSEPQVKIAANQSATAPA
jgi:hypothetical protein